MDLNASIPCQNCVTEKVDILVEFGDAVRHHRKRLGLSQERLAERCGLDRTYMGGMERGQRNVSLRNIAILDDALDVSISELIKGLSNANRGSR